MNTVVTVILSLLIRALEHPAVQRTAIRAAQSASRTIIRHGFKYAQRELHKRNFRVN